MGLRFSKRFQILPGVRLTVGKRGIGASVGPRGASISVGRGGAHAQVGIPGTGLSYRTRLGKRQRADRDSLAPHRSWTEGPLGTFFFLVGLVGVIVLGMWALTAFL